MTFLSEKHDNRYTCPEAQQTQVVRVFVSHLCVGVLIRLQACYHAYDSRQFRSRSLLHTGESPAYTVCNNCSTHSHGLPKVIFQIMQILTVFSREGVHYTMYMKYK